MAIFVRASIAIVLFTSSAKVGFGQDVSSQQKIINAPIRNVAQQQNAGSTQGSSAADQPTDANERAVGTDGSTGNPPPGTLGDYTNDRVDKDNNSYIKIWRSIMAPKNVADTFGHRIASKYIAMQVTVANRSKDFQWLIQDASVDVSRLLTIERQRQGKCKENLTLLMNALEIEEAPRDKNGRALPIHTPGDYRDPGDHNRVTSADLTILRGVAEKGQSLDPRNITVHTLTAAGIVAAGLVGVTRVGHSYAPGVAAFNGPLISAVEQVVPDYTVNQLNRLNDSAFLANTVVGKQQAKVIVVFIPQSDLLTKEQEKLYYKNPEAVYACPDLRMLEASVDGNFITTVAGSPMITAVAIDSPASFQGDNFTVTGSITGNFLAGTDVKLISPPDGVTIKRNGDSTDNQIKFSISGTLPVMPGTSLDFAVQGKTGDPVHANYKVEYAAPAPTLTSLDNTTVKAGESVTVTAKGTHFQPQGMKVLIDPSAGLTVGPVQFQSSQEVKFDVAASATAAAGNRTLKVASTGGVSESSQTLAVTK